MRLNRWCLPLSLSLSLIFALAALSGGAVSPAAAQSAASADRCEEDAECTRLATQANEMTAMGLLQDAQRAYESAYKRRPDPKLLYERARVLHKMGRFVDAALYYRRFLDLGVGENDKLRRKTEQYLDEALQQAQDTPPAARPTAPPVTPVTPPPPVETKPVVPPPPVETQPMVPPPAPVVMAPPPPPKKPGPPPPPKKLWQKWWFWTAVGGGAAAVGVGLGVGLSLASRPPDLTGVAQFHPFTN